MLGGLDLDHVILKMFEAEIESNLTKKNGEAVDEIPPELQKTIKRRLRRSSELAKMELSSEYSAFTRVDGIVKNDQIFEDLDLELEITRD